MDATVGVSVKVLGAVQVLVNGTARELSSRRQRALLAALTVRNGRPVPVADLVDAVWGEDPPEGARTTLQTYVSRLRGLVGQHAIVHSPAGYRLAEFVETDLAAARAVAAELQSLDRSDPRCLELALQVLDQWDGPALGEIHENDWFVGHVVELGEMHANLVDIAGEGLIRAGRCPQAVSMLELSLASNPLREPSQVLLMRALHGAGRTTEALRAASRYRQTLRDETGLLPREAFNRAEQLVLSAGPEEFTEPRPDAGTETTAEASDGPAEWASASLRRPTPMIGRADELGVIESALGSSRLVSVVGVGGVGKTRLVAEAIERAAASGPILAVELASVRDDGVITAVGLALGARADRVEPQHIVELIGSEPLLLVLDNAEHVVDSVRALAHTLLSACRGVRILVTSRERLGLPEEMAVALEPLPVDGPDADAVTLFVDRLRRARPHAEIDAGDPAIGALCRRLDGVPLALELAAGRAASLGVAAVNDRFDSLFGRLIDVDTARSRHSTLGNVVSWSIDLLGAQAQDLLAALSVFRGDFTLAAAEAVGDPIGTGEIASLFGRLIDTSLVSATNEPGSFRLLEMIRGVAAERLAASEHVGEVRRSHAIWVARQLAEIDAASVGPGEASTMARLDDIRRELSHALEWAVDSGSVSIAGDIIVRLAGPLLYRPDADLVAAIRGTGTHRSILGSPAEAAIVAADARAAFLLGDLDEVEPLADRAAEIAASDDAATRNRARHALGVLHLYQGRFDQSRRRFEPIVTDPDASLVDRLDALGGLALALCYSGSVESARAVAEEHRAISTTIESHTYRAFADYVLAEIDLAGGHVDDAAELLAEAAEAA
jgi:predicted ATPase/DNA-binding SARP family transcriptional activator